MEKLVGEREQWRFGGGWRRGAGCPCFRLPQSCFLSHDMDRFTIVPRRREGDFLTGSENPEHTASFATPRAPLYPSSQGSRLGKELGGQDYRNVSSIPSPSAWCVMGGCGVGGPGQEQARCLLRNSQEALVLTADTQGSV